MYNKVKARKKANAKYRQTGNGKLVEKKYQHSEKGKLTKAEYLQTEKGKTMNKKAQAKYWRSEKGKVASRKYQQSKKGKLARSKIDTKRRGNLGFIPLYENPFDKSEKVDWHHVTNAYVVALPKNLHQLYGGKQHREKTITIVKQIYGG